VHITTRLFDERYGTNHVAYLVAHIQTEGQAEKVYATCESASAPVTSSRSGDPGTTERDARGAAGGSGLEVALSRIAGRDARL
jgi:hypothetical protein